MSDAISVATEARNIANWDAHEAKRTLFARLVWALEDVDAIAQVNAMNMFDFMEMQAERKGALEVIAEAKIILSEPLDPARYLDTHGGRALHGANKAAAVLEVLNQIPEPESD